MRSAKTAITSIARTMTPPTAPSGFRLQNHATARHPRHIALSRSSAGFAGPIRSSGEAWEGDASPPPNLVSDARVENGIERVHGEIDENDAGDDQQVDALDHGIIPLVDGIKQEAAHPRQPEDRLDHDRATENLR